MSMENNHNLQLPGGYFPLKWWAAEVFEVKPETLKDWIEFYKIPHRRLKSAWLLRGADIVEYAEKIYEQQKTSQ